MKLFLKRERKHSGAITKSLVYLSSKFVTLSRNSGFLPGAFSSQQRKQVLESPGSTQPLCPDSAFSPLLLTELTIRGQRNTAWSDGLHPEHSQGIHAQELGGECGRFHGVGLSCWRDLEGHWELGSQGVKTGELLDLRTSVEQAGRESTATAWESAGGSGRPMRKAPWWGRERACAAMELDLISRA